METTSEVLFTVREISFYFIPLLLNCGKLRINVVITLGESNILQLLIIDFVIDH